MTHLSPNGRDRIIGQLADRQHGVLSRRQLLDADLGVDVIVEAVRCGRLRPIMRGVYAVGHVALRREGWWMAALLSCGHDATLSHFSGAALWRLRDAPTLPVHVITLSDRGRKQARIHPHRMEIRPGETMVLDGIRVTTPARTLVDLAAILRGRALRETVERAQDVRRFDAEQIAATLEGRPGTAALRDLLHLLQPDCDGARSHLERLFLKLVRAEKLPRPHVNVEIASRRRDFVWPEQRLVVETDGYRWHSSREAQRRDRARDRELTALAWRPVRFTFEEVVFEPAETAAELRKLLAARRERALPARPRRPPAGR